MQVQTFDGFVFLTRACSWAEGFFLKSDPRMKYDESLFFPHWPKIKHRTILSNATRHMSTKMAGRFQIQDGVALKQTI